MKLVEPSYEILSDISKMTQSIEDAGRLCYKSTSLGKPEEFCRMLIKKGHEAMLEHAPSISVKFIANRGFTHEIVRMRLASFAQESTRYCNYSKDKFGNELTFCIPKYIGNNKFMSGMFKQQCSIVDLNYMSLLEQNVPAQIARDILPIGIKAEIVVTANVREWRHILKLRTAKAAHPIMHELMRPLTKELQEKIPVLFEDISWTQ